jgi:hypothetical protein
MYNYGELELLILSCIWIEPKILDRTKLENKHFKNNQKIFMFMKSFYKKFGFFDNELMCRKANDRYKYRDYFNVISQLEPTSSNYDKYESLLLELYNEAAEEKWLREKVFQLANDFYLKNINSKEFKERLDNIYTHAKEICENN